MSALFEQLLDLLGVLLMYALECLRTATLPAALLAGVVLVIQLTRRRWLRPAQLGLLWGVVLMRLMLPAAPQSMLSLQSLIPESAPADHAMVSVPRAQPGEAWIPGPPVDASTLPDTPSDPPEVEQSVLEWATGWLLFAWSLGFMAILLVTPCRYVLFALRLRRCESSSEPRLTNLVRECRARLFVRRNVRAVVTSAVRQPAVMGIWRPKLLLPPHVLERSDAELRLVLLHELAHVRQWDIAVNWLMMIVRAVHWPNPVYWLASSRFFHLREQARDAMVLQAMEDDVRHDYSTLLLSLAEQGGVATRWRVLLPGLLPGLLCGLFEKRALAARLKAIGRAGVQQPWWQTAIAIIVLIVALVTGCTDPLAVAASDELTTPDIATQLAMKQGRGRYYWSVGATHENLLKDESVESQTYDITEAVDQIAAIHKVHVEVAAEAARQSALVLVNTPVQQRRSAGGTPETLTVTARTDGERRFIDVAAFPSAHAQLRQLIPAWGLGGLTQICIEVRFMNSSIELGPSHRVNWSSISAVNAVSQAPETETHEATFVTGSSAIEQRLPVMTTIIGDTVLRELVQRFQQDSRSNIMFAPKITMFNGQSGTITSQVQRPFVTGVRLVEGRREPQIEVCPDGIQMEIRPVLRTDRQTTRLSGRAFLSTLIDVKTSSAQLADGPVTIQLPRVERRTIDFQSELREGESILVACPPPSDGKGYFYMALTVRVIDEKDAALAIGLPGSR